MPLYKVLFPDRKNTDLPKEQLVDGINEWDIWNRLHEKSPFERIEVVPNISLEDKQLSFKYIK